MSLRKLGLACLVVGVLGACGSPAAPFDQLKSANVVAYRLQPVPPPTQAPAAQPGAAIPAIPGLPPELQAWAQQAAPALQQLLPPGLIPPGLIPGMPAPQAPAPAPQAQQPLFHNFPIVAQAAVQSEDIKSELADLFGDGDSFHQQHFNCLYAEFGISFSTTPGAPPNDVLLSMSCNQVQGHNFIWPHGSTGLTPDTVKALSTLLPKLFPGGGAPMASNSAAPLIVNL